MAKIYITGYSKEEYCDHCGRPLNHVIKISDGRNVGATCFDKQITAPKKYGTKSYRVGSSKIIESAKMAEFWGAAGMAKRGIFASVLEFDLA